MRKRRKSVHPGKVILTTLKLFQTNKALSIHDIYEELSKRKLTTTRATIYKHIKILLEFGFIEFSHIEKDWHTSKFYKLK